MRRLLTGDNVIVTSGAHKGQQGKVKKVLKGEERVVIDGVNIVKRHMRPTPERPSGIVEREAPVAISNVMLVDPESGKPTRVRHKVEGDQKVRVASRSGAVIPAPASK